MKLTTRDKTEIGAELARLRKERGISQEELGNALDIDKTAVAKIEKGNRSLSGSEALLLSRALGVDLDVFLAKPTTHSTLIRASMPSAPAVDELLTTMRGVVEDFFWARAITRYMTGPTTRIAPRSRRDCEPADAADDARRRLGLGDGPLHDLLAIVQQGLDVPVISVRSKECAVLGMLAIERAVPFILVNSAQAPARQRFTLAHELGHWMLGHGESVDTAVTLSEKSRGIERDACSFSAAFLLPRAAVDRWYHERIDNGKVDLPDVVSLASEYGVDEKVALIQLEEAGRITKSRSSQLRQALVNGEHRQFRLFCVNDGVEAAHAAQHEVLSPVEMFHRLLAAVRDERIDVEQAGARLRCPAAWLEEILAPQQRDPEPLVDEALDYGKLLLA